MTESLKMETARFFQTCVNLRTFAESEQ